MMASTNVSFVSSTHNTIETISPDNSSLPDMVSRETVDIESAILSISQNEPDWWYNMSLNLNGSQIRPSINVEKGLKKSDSFEIAEPYMQPLKPFVDHLEKVYREKERRESVRSKKKERKSILRPKIPKPKEHVCGTGMWVCTCDDISTGVEVLPLQKTIPPPFEPCACFQAANLSKVMHPDLDIPPICTSSHNFNSTRFIVEELPDYSVISYGRSTIPSPEPYDTFDPPPDLIIHSFLLTGENGFQVEVTQLGARVLGIRSPDALGQVDDVIIAFDRPKDYLEYDNIHFGGIVGRFADRVRGPRPELYVPGNGHTLLSENEDRDYNMGGLQSFDKEVWEAHVQKTGVLFTFMSHAGTDGFPGHVLLSVLYTVEPVNRLVVQTAAHTTAPTPMALTLPLAFNLAGLSSGENALKEHVLTCAADQYHDMKNVNGIPIFTGKKRRLGGTPYDLRIPRKLGKIMKFMPDNCYDLILSASEYEPGNEPQRVAKLTHPTTRRTLEVWSDFPALMVNTRLGLPERPLDTPDIHALSDSRAIVDKLVHDIPLQAWVMFDMLKTVDVTGARDELYHPLAPPEEETDKYKDKLGLPDANEPRPRWRERRPCGPYDTRPSHPGLNALPVPLRGPTKQPFGPKAMQILQAGGVQGNAPENPVGRVRPRYGYRIRRPQPVSGYNLKRSNVGEVQPRESLKSIRHSETVPNGDRASLRSAHSYYAPNNETGSVCPIGSMPLFPIDDKRKYLSHRHILAAHRPSVWGKTYPSTWGTERLRAGADASDFVGLGDYNPPDQQYYDQWAPTQPADPYQYPASQYDQYYPYDQYTDQYANQYANQYTDQYTNQYTDQYTDHYNYQYPDYQTPSQSYQDPYGGYYDPNQYAPQYDDRSYAQDPQYYQQNQWPQDQYPDMWPHSSRDDQWPGTHYDDEIHEKTFAPYRYDPRNPLHNDKFYKPQEAHTAIRRSGLGSIAKGAGKIGVHFKMVGAMRPSGFASILARNVPVEDSHLKSVVDEMPQPKESPEPTGPVNLPTEEFEISDKLKQKLFALRRPPNPGYEVRMPMKPKKGETEDVTTSVLEKILSDVHTPPRTFRGLNYVRYYKNGAILLQPQMEPLISSKLNVGEVTLRPGKQYRHTSVYVFGVIEKKIHAKKHRNMGESKVETEKEELMVDHCSPEVSTTSETSSSFAKLHDSCSEKSQSSKLSV